MLTELNFVWMNVPTYQPYVNETSFENLIYLNEAGTNFVSLSSLRNIFKPLAPRIKKLFQIIAKERLENANNRQYKGIGRFDLLGFDVFAHTNAKCAQFQVCRMKNGTIEPEPNIKSIISQCSKFS